MYLETIIEHINQADREEGSLPYLINPDGHEMYTGIVSLDSLRAPSPSSILGSCFIFRAPSVSGSSLLRAPSISSSLPKAPSVTGANYRWITEEPSLPKIELRPPIITGVHDLPKGNLTIRDFPTSGFQLHIHENPGGTAHIWDYPRKYKIEINSYDAAMADLSADKMNIKRIIKKYGIDTS